MASKQCLVCNQDFGNRSLKLDTVTPSLEVLIKELIWHDYDSNKGSCSQFICKTCKINVYALSRGKTEKLATWIDKISKVSKSY